MYKYIFLSLILISCATTPQEEPVIIQPPVTDDCVVTCDHLKVLGCPEAEDIQPPEWNPDGEVVTCPQFCAANKKFFDFNCWGKVKKCDEINSCPAP